MRSSVYKSIRDAGTHQGDAVTHHQSKRERHSRTPDSVLNDKRLSLESRTVYTCLARHAFKGGMVYMGQRRIANLLGVNQSTVSRRLQELLVHGHVETLPTTVGRRAGYHLTSTIFLPREHLKREPAKRISPTVRAASAWAETSQGERGATLDEIIGGKTA